MAADLVILGDLTLSSDPYGIDVNNGHDFLEPPPELTMRARAVKHGDVLVKKRYPNVIRTIRLIVDSSDGTKDSLNSNIRAIQTELRKLDVGDPLVLQYTPSGGSVDNFSDVIVGSRETRLDYFYVERNLARGLILTLECEPFWRGSQITIAQQTFGPTPAVIRGANTNLLSDNQADIETNTAGLVENNPTSTISRTTDEQLHGLSSLQTITDGIAVFEGFATKNITVTKSRDYTVSLWLMGSGTVTLTMFEDDIDDVAVGTTASPTITLDGTWTRYSVSRTFGATGVRTRLKVQTVGVQAITFYADCLQIEQSSFATNWVLPFAEISGDMETPVFIEIQAGSTNDFGNDLYIGTRKTPITETNFDPIKDFQGTSTGGTFNGEYTRTAISTGFTSLTANFNENLNGVSFVSTGVGWVCGDAGLIQKTTDSGLVWVTQASTLTSKNLNAIVFATTAVGFIVGDNGTVLQTSDGGVTWGNSTVGQTLNFQGLVFSSSNVGWVGGGTAKPFIMRTVDGFASTGVTTQLNITGGEIQDITAPTSNVLYACALDGDIYSTTNSGEAGSTWSQKLTQANPLLSISAPTSSVAYTCGLNGTVLQTVDGGISWSTQTTPIAAQLNSLQMLSSAVGWVVGDNGTILNTTDSGATWNQQTSNTVANLEDLSVVNSSDVYAVGGGYEILRTADGGAIWVQMQASWALSSVSDYRGRYRVFARVRSQSADPTTVSVRALSGFAGGTAVANDSVAMTVATDTWEVMDLGEINIPITRVSDEISPTPIITIEALDTSGGTNFDIDVAVLLPIDGEAAFIDSGATQAEFITLDSDSNAINKGFTRVTWNGSPPMLRPGLRNNIVILETSTGNNGGINDALVTMKYFARFLQPESSA